MSGNWQIARTRTRALATGRQMSVVAGIVSVRPYRGRYRERALSARTMLLLQNAWCCGCGYHDATTRSHRVQLALHRVLMPLKQISLYIFTSQRIEMCKLRCGNFNILYISGRFQMVSRSERLQLM